MKLSTNTILIIFGILALGMMAMFPISLVAAQVLSQRPEQNSQTDVQAMVTQTMLALTANAPDPNLSSTYSDCDSGDQYPCAHCHTASRGDAGYIL